MKRRKKKNKITATKTTPAATTTETPGDSDTAHCINYVKLIKVDAAAAAGDDEEGVSV